MIATASIAVSVGEDRPKHAAELARFSPTLAVVTDLWAQTVAHRVGCNAGKHWDKLKVRQDKGLSAWQFQRDWRAASAGQWEYPRVQRLSPWARLILEEAKASQAPRPELLLKHGSINHAGDARAIQLAYLTMRNLLTEEHLWRTRWEKRGQGLLTWLFLVPIVYEMKTDVESWCAHEWGDSCTPAKVAMTEGVLRSWASHANRRIS
ncbi:MAG: hypothetical protein ACO1SV_12380 [Fimbriimonas sp.]